MGPITALIVLALFTWAVAIWATYGGESQDEVADEDRGHEPEEKGQESSESSAIRKAA